MTKTQAVLTIYLTTATCGLGALLLWQVNVTGAAVIVLLVGCVLALVGVVAGQGDKAVAVGKYGTVFTRSAEGWSEEDTGLSLRQDLHGVWIDPAGGIWAVGGQTASFPLTEGLLVHKGHPVSAGGI